MSHFWRMVTTVMIWMMGLGAGFVGSYAGPAYTYSPIPLMASLIALVIATRYIWIAAPNENPPSQARTVRIPSSRFPDSNSNRIPSGRFPPSNSNRYKAKRSPTDERLQTLLALMTPDERDAFMDSLQRQVLEDDRWEVSVDGELSYTDDDFEDDHRRQRR